MARIIRGAVRHEAAVLVADLQVERLQVGEIQPVDVVGERPALGAGRPDAIAHAAHRHVAIVGASQHLVDRAPARGEHATRRAASPAGRALLRRAGPRGTSVPARPRSGRHRRGSMGASASCLDGSSIRSRGRCRENLPREAGEPGRRARLGSSLVPPDQRRAGAEGMLLLAVADTAAHPALLAPDFATSFTSSTTGHAFSSGVSGIGIRIGAGRVQRVRGRPKGRFYTEIDRILKADMLIRPRRASG